MPGFPAPLPTKTSGSLRALNECHTDKNRLSLCFPQRLWWSCSLWDGLLHSCLQPRHRETRNIPTGCFTFWLHSFRDSFLEMCDGHFAHRQCSAEVDLDVVLWRLFELHPSEPGQAYWPLHFHPLQFAGLAFVNWQISALRPVLRGSGSTTGFTAQCAWVLSKLRTPRVAKLNS